MKKQYNKPQIEVIKLDIHHMLAASPPPGWGGEVGAPRYDLDIVIDED